MSGYIGAVQVGSGGSPVLIGSTLYGTCATAAATAAKVVTLANFDAEVRGVTIHVKFTSGNTATSSVTLQVGSVVTAYPVSGNCVCSAGEVIAFTFEDENNTKTWRANHSIKIDTSNNIVTAISGQEVNLATQTYVDNKTAGLSGLTGAMHFRGSVDPLPSAADAFSTYDSGDVVLGPNNKEYVYNKGATGAASAWIELGDEGSYVLQTSQTTGSVGSASGWDTGTLPQLGDTIPADDITNWDAGTASSATITNGVLVLTNSTTPTLAYTAKTIPNVTSVGTLPSLSVSSTPVIVPATT